MRVIVALRLHSTIQDHRFICEMKMSLPVGILSYSLAHTSDINTHDAIVAGSKARCLSDKIWPQYSQ